jgi:hypothetical protein
MELGDGNLEMNGNEARMRFHLKDQAFSIFLWTLFDSIGIVGAPPKETSNYHKVTGKTYTAYQFTTFTLPCFT